MIQTIEKWKMDSSTTWAGYKNYLYQNLILRKYQKIPDVFWQENCYWIKIVYHIVYFMSGNRFTTHTIRLKKPVLSNTQFLRFWGQNAKQKRVQIYLNCVTMGRNYFWRIVLILMLLWFHVIFMRHLNGNSMKNEEEMALSL